MKKHIISLFALTTVFLAATTTSCTDEILPGTVTYTGAFTPKGEIVDAYLTLNVAELSIKATTRVASDDSEDERRISDIWVFQYDYESGDLIDDPHYYIIDSDKQEILSHLEDYPVTLSTNDPVGSPSIVYVVANTHDENWAKDENEEYTEFNSLTKLKMQTIPNPAPIRMNAAGDEVEGDANNETTLYIPMGGSLGEDGDLTVTNSGDRITVPVERMFAKLYVTITLTNGVGVDDSNMERLLIDHISNSCTVATVFNGSAWYYPSETGSNFDVSRTFVPDNDTTGTLDDDPNTKTYGAFILYVPENYQNPETISNAINLTPYLDYEIPIDNGTAKITPSPSYTAYPGSWDADNLTKNYGDNYEIRRNNIYDITIHITANDVVTPSANCLIATAGTTIAFYPYVRDEELTSEMSGSTTLAARYTFETYLNSSYKTEADANDGKKIKGVKIIWQTDGCIGNNVNRDLVWIDDASDSEDSEVKSAVEYRRKIYVKAAKAGNALIAAYDNEDCTGNILWSWHIWVPNAGVDPEGGAIEYYHYLWNEEGIQAGTYVPGRLVMNLNLGALSEKPSTPGVLDHDTYGMLYQWGRKDPFLPMKTTPNVVGAKGGQSFYNYADYTFTNSYGVDYTIEIGAHDNENVAKKMIEADGVTGYDGSIGSTGYLFDTNAANTVTGGSFGDDDDDVILNSIQHPTTFIAASIKYTSTDDMDLISTYKNEGDWLPDNDDLLWGGGHTKEVSGSGSSFHVYTQSAEGTAGVTALVYDYSIDAYLEDDYGPNKTIFDPCPYGWRVSPGDIWLGFTKDGLNWEPGKTNKASEYWDGINVVETSPKTVANQCGYTMYMQGWGVGETSFFPIQGTRISSGQPYNAGPICGNYHNATVDNTMTKSTWNGNSIRRVDILHFHCQNSDNNIANVNPPDGEYSFIRPFTTETWYYDKSVAGPLRCVRDTK